MAEVGCYLVIIVISLIKEVTECSRSISQRGLECGGVFLAHGEVDVHIGIFRVVLTGIILIPSSTCVVLYFVRIMAHFVEIIARAYRACHGKCQKSVEYSIAFHCCFEF